MQAIGCSTLSRIKRVKSASLVVHLIRRQHSLNDSLDRYAIILTYSLHTVQNIIIITVHFTKKV